MASPPILLSCKRYPPIPGVDRLRCIYQIPPLIKNGEWHLTIGWYGIAGEYTIGVKRILEEQQLVPLVFWINDNWRHWDNRFQEWWVANTRAPQYHLAVNNVVLKDGRYILVQDAISRLANRIFDGYETVPCGSGRQLNMHSGTICDKKILYLNNDDDGLKIFDGYGAASIYYMKISIKNMTLDLFRSTIIGRIHRGKPRATKNNTFMFPAMCLEFIVKSLDEVWTTPQYKVSSFRRNVDWRWTWDQFKDWWAHIGGEQITLVQDEDYWYFMEQMKISIKRNRVTVRGYVMRRNKETNVVEARSIMKELNTLELVCCDEMLMWIGEYADMDTRSKMKRLSVRFRNVIPRLVNILSVEQFVGEQFVELWQYIGQFMDDESCGMLRCVSSDFCNVFA